MQQECLENQVKKVIQKDFVDSVYSANGDVRIGDCVIKTASSKKNVTLDNDAIVEKIPLKPDECNKVPTDDEQQEEEEEEDEGSADYFCNVCEIYFETQDDLIDHMTTKHTARDTVREKKHHCDLCDFRCSTSNTLKRHRQTHSTEKPFMCEVCQKRFHFSDYLKRHMVTHRDKEKQFKCTNCDYCSAYHCNLQYHIAREHSTSKLFMCDVCDYKFLTNSELKQHLLSHSPLNFDDCDVPVEPPKKPKRTRKEVPPPTPAPAPTNKDFYKCYDCAFECTRLDMLIQHIESKCSASVSSGVIEEMKPKKQRERRAPVKHLKCTDCDYATSNGSHLKRHMQAKHSTDCDVCDFKGETTEDLRHHRPVHNDKKCFRCTECKYTSAKNSMLKHHMLKKHGATDDAP